MNEKLRFKESVKAEQISPKPMLIYDEGFTAIETEDFKKDTNIENVSNKRYKMYKSGMRQNYNEETTNYLE